MQKWLPPSRKHNVRLKLDCVFRCAPPNIRQGKQLWFTLSFIYFSLYHFRKLILKANSECNYKGWVHISGVICHVIRQLHFISQWPPKYALNPLDKECSSHTLNKGLSSSINRSYVTNTCSLYGNSSLYSYRTFYLCMQQIYFIRQWISSCQH